MKQIFYLLFGVIFLSCSGGGSSIDLEGFETQSISNSDSVIAIRKDGGGRVLEKGIVQKGIKNGIWTTYHDNDRVKTISNYVNGKLNGTHFELNNRGQIEFKAEYINEQYSGIVANYRFGRLEKEMSYVNGMLDGPFSEYSDRGIIQRKGSFKNGKQDGKLQYFDEEENIIMEYEYKNGEKISGGIIDKEESEE